jgi:pyruvate/2-oxoglutarate dehydrogenase complex dihydrolipoamide dehydrogenase (E3) component
MDRRGRLGDGRLREQPILHARMEDDFAIIHENLNGGRRSTRDRLVPSCVFIDPELARVGLNESEARERGVDYRVASVPVDAAWRPWNISEKRGFMKTLIDARIDRILGFTAFGPEAGELIGTVQLAMLPAGRIRL